ncbi:hypothetical protein [Coleofasciculus chthonoplastes]|uniref:hypothetical protein n=1 Tax=Coleofasciculus chthonoplastes TaxID=64178 RepID=UPI0032FA06CA
MADVDIGEVLLAIARQVSQSLTDIALVEPRKLKEFLAGALEVLNSEVTGIKLKIPGLKLLGDSVGDVGMTSDKDKFSLYFGIGEITTRTKI